MRSFLSRVDSLPGTSVALFAYNVQRDSSNTSIPY